MDAARPAADAAPTGPAAPYEGEPTQPVRLGELTEPPSDDDSGVLLIDFR
jgi:hypothetical protein